MEDLCRAVRQQAVEILSDVVDGRTVILAGSAAHSRAMERFFLDAGAVAVPSVALPPIGGGLAQQLAAIERLLAEPSADIAHNVELIDPRGRAVVYAGSFTAARAFCGRRVIGARTTRHFTAERKDVQDRLLARRALRLPLRQNDITTVRNAVTSMAAHGPVVVQGVPRGSLAMATSHTYAVPSTASDEAICRMLAAMARDCAAVMLTEMNRGTSCTYYGFVTPDSVIDLGPFEALVFWDAASWRVHAPGIMRPLVLRDGAEAACRSAVRVAARRLHQHVGYSGAFGTDGVVVGVQYAIHEINPRICAGFALLDRMCQVSVPLTAVDLALRECRAAAQQALVGLLGRLAAALRAIQRPLVALWADDDQQIQERLTQAAQHTNNPAEWPHHVRATLAGAKQLMPIMELT